MSLCRTLRAFASLYEDAFDALIELAFAGTKRAADDIWERAKAEAAERGRATVAERRAERLAEAEAKEEVWQPYWTNDDHTTYSYTVSPVAEAEAPDDLIRYGSFIIQSSPVVQPAQAATGERPAPPSRETVEGDTDVAGAGHPSQRLLAAAAYGLREYADSEDCGAPTYWRSIAGQLDAK